MMTSRRRLTAVLVCGAACALTVGCVSGCSRGPNGLPAGSSIAGNVITGTAPPLTVLTRDTSGGKGDIFIAPAGGGYPAGPEIVTTAGKVVWFHRLPGGEVATDFRAQTYLGKPVLTWFQSGHAAAAASATLPNCAASELGVWVAADYGQGASGSTFIPLEFTNVDNRTCTLQGYPAVAALDRNMNQLGPAATRNHLFTPPTVTLAPGQTAHAMLQYIQAVATNCPLAQQVPAYELQVNPPHRTNKDHALFDFETCPGTTVYLTVTAIRAGTLGT